jgi:translation initiation factor 2 subunit 1
MYYKKKGLPEEGEIVICKVTKILYHSVFVSLEEYENLDGMIHISEISPGRIRNLRDYVTEGKQIVCKVLNIKKEKNQIELSLRRINQAQKIGKSQEFKFEQRAEKILEFIGKESNKDLESMYKLIGYKLIEEFGTLNEGFEKIVADEEVLNDFKLNKKTKDILIKILSEKIKPKSVEVQGILELKTRKPAGIKDIKEILQKIQKGEITINYISAPKYKITVTASDYKTAEGILKQVQEDAIKLIEERGGKGSFEKIK